MRGIPPFGTWKFESLLLLFTESTCVLDVRDRFGRLRLSFSMTTEFNEKNKKNNQNILLDKELKYQLAFTNQITYLSIQHILEELTGSTCLIRNK